MMVHQKLADPHTRTTLPFVANIYVHVDHFTFIFWKIDRDRFVLLWKGISLEFIPGVSLEQVASAKGDGFGSMTRREAAAATAAAELAAVDEGDEDADIDEP